MICGNNINEMVVESLFPVNIECSNEVEDLIRFAGCLQSRISDYMEGDGVSCKEK